MHGASMGRAARGAAILVLLMGGAAAPRGQDPVSREEELLEYIKALEERLTQLEAIVMEQRLDHEQPVKQPPDLEGRVEKLESAVEQTMAPRPEDMRAFWRDGLRFETEDGRFKLRIGGRVHLDWGWFNDGNDLRKIFGDTEDGVKFRRTRLDFRGTVYDDFDFRVEMDFAGGDANFRDVYVAASNVPFLADGQVKIGHFREPFSLDGLVSTNDLVLMELALPTVFAPGRNVGVQVKSAFFDDRMTAALGVFRDTDDFGDGFADGGYHWTGRITGLPRYQSESRYVHLGAAASLRNVDGEYRLRQRPETSFPERFLDTGTLFVDDVTLYGLEAAVVWDRLTLQGEYMQADVDRVRKRDVSFDGWYLQASLFLTRDFRPYRMREGIFGGIRPARNFSFRGQGWGAWELALRYSQLDLTDGRIFGGEERNWTVGLNWYLNPHLKVMLNYIHADIDRRPLYRDYFEALTARFQLAF